MGWLLALGAIVLAIYSRGFRLVAAGVIVVGAVLIVYSTASFNNEREAARSLIPLTDVEIDDARLGGFDRFTGRIRNSNRSHTLSSFDVKVTIRDCAPSGQCEVVGQTNTSVYANVPPGQARDFSDYLFFNPPPRIRGRMEWSYVIDATSGEN
jgi:hypothetical protein